MTEKEMMLIEIERVAKELTNFEVTRDESGIALRREGDTKIRLDFYLKNIDEMQLENEVAFVFFKKVEEEEYKELAFKLLLLGYSVNFGGMI